MAGSCHERHLLPLRHPCCRLRGCHYHLYVPVGPARHRKDRPAELPLRHRVGLHGVRAEVRHPALRAFEYLRHPRRVPHRRAGGPADGSLPLESGSSRCAQCGRHGGGAAERRPQRGVRSAGHAGAGACGGEGVWKGVGRLPAVGHRGAVHHDTAQHRVGVGDGPQRRAARV